MQYTGPEIVDEEMVAVGSGPEELLLGFNGIISPNPPPFVEAARVPQPPPAARRRPRPRNNPENQNALLMKAHLELYRLVLDLIREMQESNRIIREIIHLARRILDEYL